MSLVASYLLNHAPNQATLLKMLQAIAKNLKPHGRTVHVNNNLHQAPETFDCSIPYGFRKTAQLPLVDGTPLEVEFLLADGTEFKVIDFYLSPATYEQTFLQAGFSSLNWIAPEVSPAGLIELGADYWRAWLTHQPIVIMTAHLSGN